MDRIDPTIDDSYANDGIWMNTTQTVNFTNINDNYSLVDQRRYCIVDYGAPACDPFPSGTPIPVTNRLVFTPNEESTIYYATRDNAENYSTLRGQ